MSPVNCKKMNTVSKKKKKNCAHATATIVISHLRVPCANVYRQSMRSDWYALMKIRVAVCIHWNGRPCFLFCFFPLMRFIWSVCVAAPNSRQPIFLSMIFSLMLSIHFIHYINNVWSQVQASENSELSKFPIAIPRIEMIDASQFSYKKCVHNLTGLNVADSPEYSDAVATSRKEAKDLNAIYSLILVIIFSKTIPYSYKTNTRRIDGTFSACTGMLCPVW